MCQCVLTLGDVVDPWAGILEGDRFPLFESEHGGKQVIFGIGRVMLDLWMNIKNVAVFGGLARMQLSATNTSNDAFLTITITQPGAPDSSLSGGRNCTWRTPSDAGIGRRSRRCNSHDPSRRNATVPRALRRQF